MKQDTWIILRKFGYKREREGEGHGNGLFFGRQRDTEGEREGKTEVNSLNAAQGCS